MNTPLGVNLDKWSLGMLAETLDFPDQSRMEAALGAIEGHGYHTFPLRDDRGHRRVISAPHPWLKQTQRRLYDDVLLQIPVSKSSYCRPGLGVANHAEQHIGHDFLTVMDVSKCFPSTDVQRVRNAFVTTGMPIELAGTLTRITTHHGILPQGPPTSPSVLDVVFVPIDAELELLAAKFDATYSRYMDDLAFSSNTPLDGLARNVVRVLRRHGYVSNDRKRRVFGPDSPHTITNIVVTTNLNASEEFLKALVLHMNKFEDGHSPLSVAQLRGRIEWVRRLNPRLGNTLRKRFRTALTARKSLAK